jgi:hypothetical protein
MKLFKLLPVIGLFIVNAAVKADDEVGKPVDIVVLHVVVAENGWDI